MVVVFSAGVPTSSGRRWALNSSFWRAYLNAISGEGNSSQLGPRCLEIINMTANPLLLLLRQSGARVRWLELRGISRDGHGALL